MLKINKQQADTLKEAGYVFKPHYLYQSEKSMLLIDGRAYQVELNGKPVNTAKLIRLIK